VRNLWRAGSFFPGMLMRRELLLDFRRNGATILSMSVVADTCGALKLFVNVATIRSDAFWFSAMP
jgi:hypothetical protein